MPMPRERGTAIDQYLPSALARQLEASDVQGKGYLTNTSSGSKMFHFAQKSDLRFKAANLDLLRSFAVLLVLFDHTIKFLGFEHYGSFDINWMGRIGVTFFSSTPLWS
jgi:hypothetical protein